MSASQLLELVRSADQGDDDRTVILDAARSAILDFGIRRTSMGEVARRAKVSPATLHRRFGQKSEVVMALILREVRTFLGEVDRSVDIRGTVDEQIGDLVVVVFNGIRTHPLLTRLLVTEPETTLPLLTTDAAPVLQLGQAYLAEFIVRLQDEGKVPPFDATPVAEILARIALSLALTPDTTLPLGDAALRRFASDHLAPIVLKS